MPASRRIVTAFATAALALGAVTAVAEAAPAVVGATAGHHHSTVDAKVKWPTGPAHLAKVKWPTGPAHLAKVKWPTAARTV